MTAKSYVVDVVLPATLRALPSKMNSTEACALLVAIALQESGLVFRRQIGGPARGFWQFEMGGLKGVMTHLATRPIIEELLRNMQYGLSTQISYDAIEDNDVLACAFARLLLWTNSKPLPKANDAEGAWQYYLFCWRPGAPRRADWTENFSSGWAAVEQPGA